MLLVVIIRKNKIIIITDEATGEEKEHVIPAGLRLLVENGGYAVKGQCITEGYENPADILRVKGLDAVYEYIIKEIQRVYRLQDVKINDKHIEVIARQMTRKIRVDFPGDTTLLMGSSVDVTEFDAENERINQNNEENPGHEPLMEAVGSPILLGITKASLSTDSFLSAASFQETTKVLTEAAIKGKCDYLLGLKENVIIGKLIPAGTGMEQYRDVEVDLDDDDLVNNN